MELYSSKNHKLFGDLYCAVLSNWSGSLEENMAPIYEKRIWHCPDKPERGFGHINTAMVAQLKYEAVNKYGLLQVQPYVLCNLSPEANVIISRNNFKDLAFTAFTGLLAFNTQNNTQNSLSSSKLFTLGCMINCHSDRFSFNFEWAVNKGSLKIYGIDNNRAQILNYLGGGSETLKPALTVNNTVVALIDYFFLYYSFVNDIDQPIINSSPKGPEYNTNIISDDPFLRNTFTRFVNPKKINYQGAMAVLDFAYWLKPDKLILASTAGFATGGSFELNQIYSGFVGFSNDPQNNIALDESGSYGGFISLQELYTGLWVKSAFGMGGPFVRPNLSTYIDFTSSNQGLLFKELFTDIKFLGFSTNFFPTERLSFSSNATYYWSFCAPTEIFVKQNDNIFAPYNIDRYELSKNLGLEVFLIGKYELPKSLNLYLSWAIFFPGSRYFDKYLNPLDYFDSYSINSNLPYPFTPEALSEFFSSLPPDTTKFNPVYLFNTGFEYSF
jgi:hypothetical protein